MAVPDDRLASELHGTRLSCLGRFDTELIINTGCKQDMDVLSLFPHNKCIMGFYFVFQYSAQHIRPDRSQNHSVPVEGKHTILVKCTANPVAKSNPQALI